MNIGAFSKMNRRTTLVLGGLIVASAILANVPAALALIGNQHGGSPASNGGGGHVLRQPAAVTNGLVGWWKLDGDAKDETANHNDGTVNGTTVTIGKFGQGYSFNGSTSYIDAGNPAILKRYNSDFTIDCWFKLNSYPTSYVGVLVSNRPGGSLFFVRGELDATNKRRIAFDTLQTGGTRLVYGTTALGLNNWYHAAVTFKYNGNNINTVKLYLNGQLENSDSTVSNIGDPGTNSTWIGFEQGSPPADYHLNGSMDDVRIYNRALSAAEIAKLYAGSNPTNCDQTCVGYWKLDEGGSATTTADISGNGNAGTLMNGTSNSPAANGTTNGPLWTSGVFGNGITFDGSNDYVSVVDSNSLELTNNATWSGWFKFNANNVIQNLIQKDSMNGYAMYLSASGKISLYLPGTIVSGNTTVSTNVWHYLSVVKNSTTATIYLDGMYDGNGGVPAAIPTNNLNLGIGAKALDGSGPTNGVIDDVRIYSRALAPYEIYDQYLAGR